jgi:phosphatidylglycerophosphatase A
MPKTEPSLKQPAIFLSTLGGIGYLPKAPGTWASLVTLAPVFLIQSYSGFFGLIVFCSLIFIVGIWASTHHEKLTKSHDSKHCVIDECLGQSLVLLFTPNDLLFYLLAFVYFRFFDIIKPWPTNWFDQNVKGGLGVMIDDVVAGAQAIIVMGLTHKFLDMF